MRSARLRKSHGSIPGYRPGPILSRNQKLFLWSLIVIPGISYGIMRLRQDGREEQEKLLELEGREMWNQKHGDAANLEKAPSAGRDTV